MKTKIFKTALPFFVFVFAIGAAFASNAHKAQPQGKAFTNFQGYLHAPAPCTQSILCSDSGATICKTAAGAQVWGMDVNGVDCNRQLYKIQ
jgi:hypothetical protein